MALVSGQFATASGAGTSIGVAFPSANTAGNLLVAYGCSSTNESGYADSRNTPALAVAGDDSGNGVFSELYYVQNCGAGANTMTRSHSFDNASICIAEFDQVATTGALQQTNGTFGFSTSAASGNITTTVADCVLIGGVGLESAGAPVAATGSFTEITESGGARTSELAYRTVTATGSYQYTATLQPTPVWGCIVAAFKLALVAPTAVVTGTMIAGGVTEAEIVSG